MRKTKKSGLGSYSAEKASKLRQKFGFDGWDDSFDEPDVKNFSSFGNFQLVGHGKPTNMYCGKYMRLKGCLRVDLHNIITLEGKSYKGKIFRRKVHSWCHKPSCPICYKSGWAIRQAGNIEGRLIESAKRFGVVEHIVCSVPPKDYGLSYEALRKKAHKVLAKRGVIGGNLIFHGMRYNLRKSWYWSPHFHVLGHILGGFSRCRNCNKSCAGCDGFKERQKKLYYEDKYIVKVLGKRKTVFGTAWYQLNHASIDVTKKRFHVSTWFGVCSYRKLKVTPEKKRQMCPICRYHLVPIVYHGVKRIVTDRSADDYERDSFEDYEEDGRAVYVEKEARRKLGTYDYG